MSQREVHSEIHAVRIDRVTAWWWIRDGRAAFLVWAAFLLFSLVYLAGIVAVGIGPITNAASDLFVQLDGSWRVYQGQVPHRDFYTALGPLEYLITAAGFVLTRGTASGISVGSCLFGAASAVAGWFLARRRMPLVPSLLFAAWLLVTATCPTPLGFPPHSMGGGERYNRHGYVLLGLLLVESSRDSTESFWDGVASGSVLVLLAFLKLNFVGAGVVLFLASLPFRWRDKKRARGLVTGFAATLAAFLLYLRFAVAPLLGDMALAIKGRASTFSKAAITGGMMGSDKEIVAILFASAALAILAVAVRRSRAAGLEVFLMGLAVVVTGFVLQQTNFGESGVVLASVWLLITVGHLSFSSEGLGEKLGLSLAVLLCCSSLYADFSSAAKSYVKLLGYGRATRVAAGFTIAAPNAVHMRFYEDEGQWAPNNGAAYVRRINDGLALLAKVATPEDRVMELGYANPFPFILRLKPMRGGSPWLLLGNDVSLQHLPPAERVFGDATIMMTPLPDGIPPESDQALAEAYRDFIKGHFVVVGQSRLWIVYRRTRE